MKYLPRIKLFVMLFMMMINNFVWAATNEATDPGGGSVVFVPSGPVTVNTAVLQLIKQVWDSTGTTCLASSPVDPLCNGGETSIIVPLGTVIKFLIYAANTTDVAITDLRIQDAIDISPTGFNYSANSITFDDTQSDVETAANIFAAANAGTPVTDTVSIADAASYNSGTISVGAVTGQVNQTAALPGRKTFAIVFAATKN